jgi:hypothetical protein
MGMFDTVHIYKAWFPSYEAMNVKSEWQTKSLSNILAIITIDKEGFISTKDNLYDDLPIDWGQFTKTIEIHNYENRVYWSYLLQIENGKLTKIKENVQ